MSARIEVAGRNELADTLRDGLGRLGHMVVVGEDLDAFVEVHVASSTGRAIEDYDDDAFRSCWETPLRDVVAHFVDARARGARRFVIVTSSSGMTGAATDAPVAMASDALRSFMKSVARQWGSEGRTVNTVVVDPVLLGSAPETVSIAPRALGSVGTGQWDVAPVVAFCCSDDSHHLTGSTLMADGGSWMP